MIVTNPFPSEVEGENPNTFGTIIRENKNGIYIMISQPSLQSGIAQIKELLKYCIKETTEKGLYSLNEETMSSIISDIDSWNITDVLSLDACLDHIDATLGSDITHTIYWNLQPHTSTTYALLLSGARIEPIDNYLPNAIYMRRRAHVEGLQLEYYGEDIDQINSCASTLFQSPPYFS